MKQKLNEIQDYNIITLDGDEATVKDFLFDDQSWILRYIEADFGGLFTSNRILIPKDLIRKSEVEDEVIYVALTKEDIENCPKPEDDLPVSRKYEEELSNFYNTPAYWSTFPITGTSYGYEGGLGGFPNNKQQIDEDNLGTHLRSYKEIRDYSIAATDGKLGTIDDLVLDDENWKIGYLIIDTSKWFEWGKKVLLDVEMISKISYQNSEIHVNAHIETIRKAPEYNPLHPIGQQYENALHYYYETK